jgi:hypothetical protein
MRDRYDFNNVLERLNAAGNEVDTRQLALKYEVPAFAGRGSYLA